MSEPATASTPIDHLGRPTIAEQMKLQIAESFRVVPADKRAALILIGDTRTGDVRLHLAARFDDGWKVAAGGGFAVPDKRGYGFLGLEKVW